MASTSTNVHRDEGDRQSVAYLTAGPDDQPTRWLTITRGASKINIFIDREDAQFLRDLARAAYEALDSLTKETTS